MDNMQLWLESSTTKINLNSAVDGYFLNPDLEGLTGLPEIRTTSGVNAGYDGGWTSAQYFDARLITIRGVIVDSTVSTLESKRKALVALAAEGRHENLTLKFVSQGGSTYSVIVRTTGLEMALQRVFARQEYLLQLRADDPLIYDDGEGGGTEAIIRVQQALGGFEIPFEFPLAIGGGSDTTTVDNLGTEQVYPLITLYGPLHNPTVINRTTNQQMQILADLQYAITWSGYQNLSGDRIAIDDGLVDAPMSLTQINGTIQTILPSEYQQITYIEAINDGESRRYIDTEVQLGSNDFEISCDVEFLTGTGYERPILSIWTSTYGYWNLFRVNNNLDCYTGGHHYINDGAFDDTRYKVGLKRTGNSWTMSNGVDTDTTWTYAPSNTNNTTLKINARGDVNDPKVTSARYYGITIKVGTNVVRNYIPAIRKSDNAVGLYDTIDGTFNPSALDAFIAGNNVPNPNYPQEMQTVIDEQNIKVEGKNLFSTALEQGTILGTSGEHGSVVSNRIRTANRISVMPNQTLTLSLTSAKPVQAFCFRYKKDGSWIDRIPANWVNLPYTFQASGETYQFEFVLSHPDTSDLTPSDMSEVQLELGSTATAYEPYQGQSQEVNLGKNLFDAEYYETATYTSGTYKYVATNFEGGKTYTFSATLKAGKTAMSGAFVCISDATNPNNTNNRMMAVYNGNSATTGITASFASNATIYFQFYPTTLDIEQVFDTYDFQLEEGSVRTPYQAFTPYHYELAKVGNYQDRIYKDEGKWWIEKQIGKVVLNGNETWVLSGNNANNQYLTAFSGFPAAYYPIGKVLCDHFEVVPQDTAYNTKSLVGIGGWLGSEQIRISFDANIVDRNVTDFKAWLASNPTTVYYALATPTTTEITDATLLAQLNHIYQLYGGTNNISLTPTAGAQGTMEISYATENTIDQDVVIIDSQLRTITLNGADAYHLKTPESEFIMLEPGENVMTLTSAQTSDSGYAVVKYKGGHLTI